MVQQVNSLAAAQAWGPWFNPWACLYSYIAMVKWQADRRTGQKLMPPSQPYPVFSFLPQIVPLCSLVAYVSLPCVFPLLFSSPLMVPFLPHLSPHTYRFHMIFYSSIHFPEMPWFYFSLQLDKTSLCNCVSHFHYPFISWYRPLSWFHFLAIVNSPIIKMYIQVSVIWWLGVFQVYTQWYSWVI